MEHRASPAFWHCHARLSATDRERADKQFALLKKDPQHPSLHLKKLWERKGMELWSARVSREYRALAVRKPDAFLWFWIGHHSEYESLIA